MKITSEQLKEYSPCADGLAWFESVKMKTPEGLLKAAGNDEQKLNWCNWGIVRLLSKENRIRYAIYAARKVLHIYEEKYPQDDRPRKAIETAEKYLNEPTEENRKAAYAAASAAYAADYAASAAAYAAAYAADYAASVASVAYAAYAEMKIDIISYGIKLLEAQDEN